MPPPPLRAAIRAKLLECDLPPDRADQVADLAYLAVADALAALDRTAARAASFGDQLTILSIALGAAQAVFRQHYTAIEAASRETGAQVVSTSITMPGYAR